MHGANVSQVDFRMLVASACARCFIAAFNAYKRVPCFKAAADVYRRLPYTCASRLTQQLVHVYAVDAKLRVHAASIASKQVALTSGYHNYTCWYFNGRGYVNSGAKLILGWSLSTISTSTVSSLSECYMHGMSTISAAPCHCCHSTACLNASLSSMLLLHAVVMAVSTFHRHIPHLQAYPQ